jgi:hypothetical protein
VNFYTAYHVSILPQMDNDPLFKAIVSGGSGAARPYKSYFAPGDPTNGPSQVVTSYLFNDHAFLIPTATTAGGAVYCNNRFPASFKDGPSQTIGWIEGYSDTVASANNPGGNRNWATGANCNNTEVGLFQIAPSANPTAALADRGQGFYSSGMQVSLFDGSVRTLGPALANSSSGVPPPGVSGPYSTYTAALSIAYGDGLGSDW